MQSLFISKTGRWNNVISLHLQFLVDDINDYQQYIDFCEALGLPTSDQITREVMDSAS